MRGERTGDCLARVQGIEEVAKIADEDCFLLKVRASNAASPSVGDTRTTLALESFLEECGPRVALP